MERLKSPDVRIAANRCPFCHEGVEVEGSVACLVCLGRHHAACWTELNRCGSCGGTRVLAEGSPPKTNEDARFEALRLALGGRHRPVASAHQRAASRSFAFAFVSVFLLVGLFVGGFMVASDVEPYTEPVARKTLGVTDFAPLERDFYHVLKELAQNPESPKALGSLAQFRADCRVRAEPDPIDGKELKTLHRNIKSALESNRTGTGLLLNVQTVLAQPNTKFAELLGLSGPRELAPYLTGQQRVTRELKARATGLVIDWYEALRADGRDTTGPGAGRSP